MKIFNYFILFFFVATPAYAQLTGFVDSDNPNNSNEWRDTISALGGVVNSIVNFESHPVAALDTTHYSVSEGVTLSITGDIYDVRFGAGPGQSNVTSGPLSTGEGLHEPSNYIHDGSALSTLTISFDQPVWGAGLFVIDHFNPTGVDPIRIEAFTGIDATGTSLGEFSSESFNFQKNYIHFVGVVNSTGNIRSIKITDVDGSMSDYVGYDDILFAPAGPLEIPTLGFFSLFVIFTAFSTMYIFWAFITPY